MQEFLKKLAKKYGMAFLEETDKHLCYIDIDLEKLKLMVVYYKTQNLYLLFYILGEKEYRSSVKDENELEERLIFAFKRHKEFLIKNKLDRIEGDFKL